MDHGYPVPVQLKRVLDYLVLILVILPADKIHRVQDRLHIRGIYILQKPPHHLRAVQGVIMNRLNPHDNAKLLGSGHNLSHAL